MTTGKPCTVPHCKSKNAGTNGKCPRCEAGRRVWVFKTPDKLVPMLRA